ncbi:hypothetical protein HN018_06690 [Lichenicola cladoniae]|uniref:Uncharacterized protein n=1 Tax=Lichenicola cladoniae TaxID=1484109 RepID=A0A6M8HN07_9PROT|nr:hypothetical protein [Lichenicola cladoniae]NPD67259.1 hypothetical protein [Acetobacteraceae bacterium]QKE89764.1 hypothetical protein HN018_06690 [Lichenicola cladoniae]
MTEQERIEAAARAQLFHETYERVAPAFDYASSNANVITWAEVPDWAKNLMTAVFHEMAAAYPATPPAPDWLDLRDAPADGTVVEVLAPGREGLSTIICDCAYHPDAGWCVDQVREVMAWRPKQTLIAATSPAPDDAVVRDAARYRWLRDNRIIYQGVPGFGVMVGRTPSDYAKDLDAAIDAARSAETVAASPAQEVASVEKPYAWTLEDAEVDADSFTTDPITAAEWQLEGEAVISLYTHPPQAPTTDSAAAICEVDVKRVKEIIDCYFAPWGSWKTATWEGLCNDGPFTADHALHTIRALITTPPTSDDGSA